jgi:hypothetical protein
VRWEEAARSMERAVLALGLSPDIAPGRLRVADEHSARSDPSARPHHRARSRAAVPRSSVRPRTRLPPPSQRHVRAWLEHQGQVRPVAESLHVHVQTVRYRVGQLHELFGPALSTPSSASSSPSPCASRTRSPPTPARRSARRHSGRLHLRVEPAGEEARDIAVGLGSSVR